MPTPVSVTASKTCGPAQVLAPVRLVELHVLELDREPPAVGHRVARVDDEVQDHLLDRAGVRLHAAQIRRDVHRHHHVLADEPAEHRGHLADEPAQVEDALLDHLLAAEREQLPGEGRAALAGPLHLLEVGAARVVRGQRRDEEVRVAQHHGEQVVEVVRHAPGEPADRLELLRLQELLLHAHELLLRPAPLLDLALERRRPLRHAPLQLVVRGAQRLLGEPHVGDVDRDAEEVPRHAVLHDRDLARVQPAHAAAGLDRLGRDVQGVALREHLAVVLDERGRLVRGEEIVVVAAQELGAPEPEQLLAGAVEPHEPQVLGALDEDHRGQVLDDRVEEGLGARGLRVAAVQRPGERPAGQLAADLRDGGPVRERDAPALGVARLEDDHAERDRLEHRSRHGVEDRGHALLGTSSQKFDG
jgi:hypothetical protein